MAYLQLLINVKVKVSVNIVESQRFFPEIVTVFVPMIELSLLWPIVMVLVDESNESKQSDVVFRVPPQAEWVVARATPSTSM